MNNTYRDRNQALRLFMAADISGSTSFKAKRPVRSFTLDVIQTLSRDSPDAQQLLDWASVFQRFFSEFLGELQRSEATYWAAENEKFQQGLFSEAIFGSRPPPQARLRPWKILGDEVVVVCELRDPMQLYLQVRAFWQTIRSFDAQLRRAYGLGLKGRIWTAGFPIRNRAIRVSTTAAPPIISTDNNAPPLGELNPVREAIYPFEDYIGLDMDIGFRLGSFTSSGRICASLEPLYFLSQTGAGLTLRLFHLGWRSLPGVYDERPYPIVWLDFDTSTGSPEPVVPYEGELNELSKAFLSMNEPTDRAQILKLFQEYRDSLGGAMITPYIHSYDIDAGHKGYGQGKDW